MFIKKLPHHEQSLLIATARINTYKNAVEELVYNSLDAEGTSIAIRINIEQSSIQVIDNGCGITKTDMHVIGQRHMTSKYTEKNNSKSIPNNYGIRGESIANIVEVSKTVEIASRHESSDETWVKRFHKNKDIHIEEISKRPSKGTTVDVKGLFYNRNIQAKCINPFNELQEIKAFLEQTCLVHTNISLSLRDDSKNEIIFQLHKKRDIYQTLSSLYSIDISELQELKVQKNEYSVTAFIAKKLQSIHKDLIFLNRKCVNNNSKLHKIINDNLNKYLKNQYHRKKSKIKYDDEEIYLYKNRLPFYFLFIRCPIKDYDIIDKLIEFSDWNQVTKILEKLVKFYVNDVKLKPVQPLVDGIPILEKEKQSADTRNQVKKIMDKILASGSKALGVSQMRNGIKGKITKRKNKKKQLNLLKEHSQNILKSKYDKHYIKEIDVNIDYPGNNKIQSHAVCNNESERISTNLSTEKLHKTKRKSVYTNDRNIKKPKRNHTSKKLHLQEKCKKISIRKKLKSKKHQRINPYYNDPIIKRFINPTDSVKNRCEILAEKTYGILNNLNQMNDAFNRVDKSIQCNNSIKDYKSIIANKIARFKNEYHKSAIKDMHIKSTIDLLKPVIGFQNDKTNMDAIEHSVVQYKNKHQYECKSTHTSKSIQNVPAMSKLTYESHNYEMITCNSYRPWRPNNLKFMSKESIDNFALPSNINIPKMWQKTVKSTYSRQLKEQKKTFFQDITKFNTENSLVCTTIRNTDEFSQNILDFPQNNTVYTENNTFEEINAIFSNFNFSNYQTENLSIFIENNTDNILSKTYILPRNYDKHSNLSIFSQASRQSINEEIHIEKNHIEFSVNNNIIDNTERTPEIDGLNAILEINSPDIQNSNKSGASGEDYPPINVCEAVYHSNDIFENEFEFSFNKSKQNNIPNIDSNSKETISERDIDCESHNKQNNSVHCSHHFNNNITSESMRSAIEKDDNGLASLVVDKEITDPIQDNGDKNQLNDTDHNGKSESINNNAFNLKNRLRFVPKGMSPIFKNCNTKQACNYNLDTDYYDENLYYNFVNDVQINSEIYEAQIQNIKSRSKHLDNWMTNVDTNDISLDFNGKSLENALVLNQVDNKFIAAIIRHNSKENIESSNLLVFFDQHAVHERIRLENNMSDYFTDGQWKSVVVDSMTMLLSKEDIIYLHNYKDKFSQLGLQWTMASSNEISINAIPEAILGKNPRQADKIIHAVRNLLAEEINNIKAQKGCISLHPKSIMDLVFSEACRYAIMFGDKLTKDYCGELIKSLSKCKKPFQCAHGRPVMAVIMDLEHNTAEYKANVTKLKHFKK